MVNPRDLAGHAEDEEDLGSAAAHPRQLTKGQRTRLGVAPSYPVRGGSVLRILYVLPH